MRFTNLQAGRFAAATAVLVFHAAVHGADYLGVPASLGSPVPAYYFRTAVVFFFALSGFVLAHGLQSAKLGAFVRSRILRLYPAYLAVALAVVAVRAAIGNPVPGDAKGYLYALTLWPAGPTRAAYAVGIEWTLVYEVFLSLALIPFAALGRRWGLGLGSALWLAVLIGKQVIDQGRTLQPFPKPGELPLSVINAPFLLGVLVYLARDGLDRARTAVLFVAAGGLTGGALMVISAPGWSMLAQSVGTAAAVAVLAGGSQLAPDNGYVRAGDWSYGIYLAHVPVMTGFYALVVRGNWFPPSESVVIFAGVLSLAAGCLYGAAEWAVYRRLRGRKPALPRLVPAPLAKAA